MTVEPKAYFKGIEKKIIELIQESRQSIIIAMAWFTNNDIKDSLINKKKNNKNIEIKIVVDENDINKKYFLNYESKFETVGIQILKKCTNRFLHNKFMVIDESITTTGSYNYSKKATNNLENIVVINCPIFSSYYSRIFDFLTNENYQDENIDLLFEYPKFAQELISTYYSFNKNEYLKYKKKILIGDCFTHDNGLYDEISYYPGLIFNSKILHSDFKKSEFFEFDIPVDKQMIKSWVGGRNMNLILDSFMGDEENYHLINEQLEKNEQAVEKYFKRKMEKTYRYQELKGLIDNAVDIILEDEIWTNNFEPFIQKSLIEKLFDKFEKVEVQRETNLW